MKKKEERDKKLFLLSSLNASDCLSNAASKHPSLAQLNQTTADTSNESNRMGTY
jgi:hypothetical protein